MRRVSRWVPTAMATCWMALLLSVSGPAAAERTQDGNHAAQRGEHGSEHGGGHDPKEWNWAHGMLGEQKGVEPSLLWRPEGTPPPLAAMLLNTAVLFFLLVYFGRRPMRNALKKRRAAIMHGIEEAARMKEEASNRLQELEDKLTNVDKEIERVKREMREAGEAERARVLAEAKERRARMEREAGVLIDQELKAAREELYREAVRAAVQSAREQLSKQVTDADRQRLADDYIETVARNSVVTAPGGRA